jgi:hypothetical protein
MPDGSSAVDVGTPRMIERMHNTWSIPIEATDGAGANLPACRVVTASDGALLEWKPLLLFRITYLHRFEESPTNLKDHQISDPSDITHRFETGRPV